jgi:hypothetical protein
MSRSQNVSEKSESRFFSPQKQGESFREVDVSASSGGTNQVTTRWFHSDTSDLYIWLDSRGEIVKQQITLNGLTVEWNILDGLRTGIVLEEEILEVKVKPSESVIWDKIPSQAAVNLAMTLLVHMKALEDPVKNKILAQFKKPAAIGHLAADEMARRFGVPTHEDSVWKSFQNFIRKLMA